MQNAASKLKNFFSINIIQESDIDPFETNRFYYYKRVLFYSFIAASLIMLPFIIIDKGVFLYYGDYNAQQIPFYRHAIESVHNGSIFWDFKTDLGSNFIGSYSYYMLGSPFFWFMCLFPSNWAPYLMGPVFIMKFMAAGVFSYAYLKRFVKNQNYAVLGGLLYAFCGFNIYNVFFNQFHEVVAFFPLLLLGMEELVQNNRKGLFAVAVMLNSMINYFMFAGQVVFCVIYFFARSLNATFKIDFKKFLWLVFEAVLGFVMGMIIFLPGALAVLDNPRVDSNGFKGWANVVFMSKGKIYWDRILSIIQSYFFPPDIPSRANFFPENGARWASLAAWVPMFGMAGVISYIKAKRRSWISILCIALFIMSLVPVLHSFFYLLKNQYYARELYMMILIMVLATIVVIEKREISFKFGLAFNAIVCSIFAITLGLSWKKTGDNLQLGQAPKMDRFWVSVLIAAVSLIITYFLIKYFRGKKIFQTLVTYAVMATIVIYGINHLFYGRSHSWSGNFLREQAIGGIYKMEFEGDEFFRIDTFEDSLDNLGLYWDVPSIRCFHTVVPPSVMEFYPLFSVERSVGTRPESKLYGLRGFLSVKYGAIEDSKTSKVKPKGFVEHSKQNGFTVMINEDFIPMGYTYTEFMTLTEFNKITASQKHLYSTAYLVVEDEDADKFSKFMKQVKNSEKKSLDYNDYSANCKLRAASAGSSFEYDNKGFTSIINLDEENYVFFSVPIDSGWSAKVNGNDAEIVKVFSGLMAVKADVGANEIRFEYTAPGMMEGIYLTIGGILVWVVYILLVRKFRKPENKPYKFFRENYYEEDYIPFPSKPISYQAVFSGEVDKEIDNDEKVDVEDKQSEDANSDNNETKRI
ncbi:MAG: YfhO family protein [Eubacteriales bacterium]|nr:YfhO family protein [Eubacteriales bacterium]MDD4475477.1 YfhO family protein [Eubacteriales bacterium]